MGLTQNLGRLSPSIFSDASLNIGVGAAPSGSYKFEITGTSKVSGVLTLGSTLSNGTYTYTLPSATGTLALVGGAGVGTVTSVAALTLGTTGTDLSSTVANSTTTPVITLNVPTASAANRGALSSGDWTTFNNKQSTITLTTSGTSGAATFTSNTLNIPNYGSALSGYVPYTGATANLDLGAFSLTTFGVSSTNTISTTAGYGILSGGGGFSIGPSATRGIIAINGSGDQLLTFSTQSYIYNSSSLFRMLSSSDIDFVAGGTQRLLISASTGAATFSSSVTTNANFINSGPVYSTTGNVGNLLFTNTYPSNYNVAQIASVLDGYFYAAKLVFRTADSANANLLVDRLTIASSGAATFSSTVQINDSLQIDNSVLNTPKSITFVANCSAGGNTALGSISWKNTQWDTNIKAQIQAATGADITEGQLLFKTGASGAAAVERMRITSGGDVCIGITSALQPAVNRGTLTINGVSTSLISLGAGGVLKSYYYVSTSGTIIENIAVGTALSVYSGGTGGVTLTSGATSWASLSDERLKNINGNIENAVEKLMTLRAVNFRWEKDKTNKENLGLIAQDVEKVFPQVIEKNKLLNTPTNPNKDENEYLAVKYTELIPVLVKAIQEQQKQIEELKQTVAIK